MFYSSRAAGVAMPLSARKMSKLMDDVRMMRQKVGSVELPEKAWVGIIPTVVFEWWGLVAEGKGSNGFAPMAPFDEARNQDNLSEISTREFGGSVGAPRLLEMLDGYGIKASWVTTGNVAERYHDLVSRIAKGGHELIGHAYDHDTVYLRLTRAQEKADIRRTTRAFEKVAPGWERNGWSTPWWLSTPNTLELLMEDRFLSHSDFLNDELPYTIHKKGKKIVEIPLSIGVNDVIGSPETFERRFKTTFDYLYKLGKSGKPKIFNFNVHAFITGRPHWMVPFENVLRYSLSLPRVWLTTRDKIAKWWLGAYPEGQVELP